MLMKKIHTIGAYDNFDNYARGYYYAALEVSELILRKSNDNEIIIYPLLFLIHHSIELRLKSILFMNPNVKLRKASKNPFKENHDLVELWENIENFLEDYRFKASHKKFVSRFIKYLSNISKKGEEYRYPYLKEKKLEILKCESIKNYQENKSKYINQPNAIIFIFNPADKQWLLIKDLKETMPEQEFLNVLESNRPIGQREDEIYRLCTRRKLNAPMSFSKYKYVSNLIERIQDYKKVFWILEEWFYLCGVLDMEYSYQKHTSNLSYDEICKIAKIFNGKPSTSDKLNAKKIIRKNFDKEISCQEFYEILNIIKSEAILSPHIGTLNNFKIINNEKINTFIRLITAVDKEKIYDEPQDAFFTDDFSQIYSDDTSDTKFIDGLMKTFTSDELSEFLALFRLGYFTLIYQDINYRSDETYLNLINYYKDQLQFTDQKKITCSKDFNIMGFYKYFLVGLELRGFICCLEQDNHQ